MAEVPGFGENFNPNEFRENIKRVMKMSAPQQVEERVTFRWPKETTHSGTVDHAGSPYDFSASNIDTSTQKPDVQIDCAVEIVDRAPTGTPMGEFNNPRAKITVLDIDYELVKGSSEVLIGGNTYNVNYIEPQGLFSVTVYIFHTTALDES